MSQTINDTRSASGPREIDLAIEHHRAGRIAQAETIYRQLVEANADDHDALHLLGVAAVQRGKYDEAVELISRSLGINPSNAHALNHLGEAYRGLQFLDEAQTCFEKALTLDDKLHQALNNLGNLHQVRGQFEIAFACYTKAVNVNPDYVEAHINLGNILQERGDYPGAIACYRKALEIQPESPEASFNLGNIFKLLRNYDEAIPLYRTALLRKPEFAEAHLALARAYHEAGYREEALACFQRGLAFAPENPEIHWGRAMSQIALVEEDQNAADDHRQTFAAGLETLECWFTKARLDTAFNAVGSQQPFYLAYQEHDNRDLLARYGMLCDRLARHWQDARGLNFRTRVRGKKVRVGLVSAHIRDHSVWNAITKGWVQHLDDRRFELYLFSLSTTIDGETELARSRATGFVQGVTAPDQWAEAILGSSLDVLIYPEIGMDPTNAKLACLRLAPVQVTTWGHPETSGFPSIDYYLSARSFEPDHAQSRYTEQLVLLPNMGCCLGDEDGKSEEIALDDVGVKVDQPLFVCPGTPFKYAPMYDWVYPAIARRLGRCQFLFFRHPNQSLTRLLMRRIEAAFAAAGLQAREYIVELPWLKKENFLGLMRQADAYLDTIGFSGFNSAMQAIESGLPVITRDGRFLRGRLASGILKQMGLYDLVAETEEAYVDLAVRIGQDKGLRTSIAGRLQHSRRALYNDLTPVRALEDFLATAKYGSIARNGKRC